MKKFIPLLIILFCLMQTVSLFADNLPAVAATGSDAISASGTYETIVTTAGLTVATGDKVMVIASFTCQTTATTNVTRDLIFQIVQDIGSTPSYSNEIIRHLTGTSTGDEGIGTLVYVFTIGTETLPTYTLQHKQTSAKASLSDATITAINLTTSGTVALGNSFKVITTGVTTTSTTFAEVPGTVSDAITLPKTGGMYFAASINSLGNTANVNNVGEWQLQYKKESGGTWTALGKAVRRSLKSPNEEGIISLVAVLENQPAGDYYFRLVDRVVSGTSNLTTFNTSVVGVALSTAGGRAFSTFKDELANQTNSSTSWETESTNTFTAAGTQAFLHAQYGMSADAASDAPGFRFTASGGSVNQNINYRSISSATDAGSGGQVGLITGLTASTSYTANFQSINTSGTTLTTSDIIFVGFQLTDDLVSAGWNGSASTDWHTAANWDENEVPTVLTNVTIPDNRPRYPDITGTSAICKNLLIATASVTSPSVTISPDFSLTVEEVITNNAGNSGLVIKSTSAGTGSLLAQNNVAGTVERYIAQGTGWTSATAAWHLLSSPVIDQAIETVFTTTAGTFNFFAGYEPGITNNNWVNFRNITAPPVWLTANNNSLLFWLGKGYLVAYQATSTKEMAGTINSADVLFEDLSLSSAPAVYPGYHVLGNPFSSAITWNNTVDGWGLSNVGGTCYVWNSTNGSYAGLSSNVSAIIPAYSGFLVLVSSGTNSITIPAAARVNDATSWYKNGNTTYPVITLSAGNADMSSLQECEVRINPASTNEYDFDFDGGFLPGYAPVFYSVANGENLMVNSIPEISTETSIPFTFIKNDGEQFFIEFSSENFTSEAWLYDKITGIEQNLIDAPVYYFTSNASDQPDRFELRFKTVGISTYEGQKPTVYLSYGNLIVNNAPEAFVDVFNISGQLLRQGETSQTGSLSIPANLPAGCYIVKIRTAKSFHTEKIIIN